MNCSDLRRVSRFAFAPDGLRLHYLEYGPKHDSRAPVVCLPGLARSAEDFDRLARALATPADGAGRRVLALDYRGRGLSDWDPEWTHYDLEVEQQDILATLQAAGVASAIFVGTSRGGIHIMLLAAARPELLRAAVINDIGPTVELAGLLRIKRYVGKLPPLASFGEAVALLRLVAGPYFTNLADADWEAYARLTFIEKDGRLHVRYDPALAHALDSVDADKPPTQFWPQFEALAPVPVLGIRGSNSDVLSPETFAEMQRRHPAFETLVVEGHGHAPLLLDAPTIAAIVDFIDRYGP